MKAPAAVQLHQVRVAAGARTLLQVDDLLLLPGECVAVVGPNGAGKSTLLRVLAGTARVEHGTVQVLGRAIGADAQRLTRAQWRALRREVGAVMQGLHLVPRLTARENVLIGALGRLRGAQAWHSWWRRYPEALVAEADAALAALGLQERAQVRADRLSGGERQKVGLARLALQQARLVLADEPTSALDPSATEQACRCLRSTAEATGQTLVTVVHDLDLLPTLATRVIGLAQGAVRWDLPLARVDAALLRELYASAAGPARGLDRGAVAAVGATGAGALREVWVTR